MHQGTHAQMHSALCTNMQCTHALMQPDRDTLMHRSTPTLLHEHSSAPSPDTLSPPALCSALTSTQNRPWGVLKTQ